MPITSTTNQWSTGRSSLGGTFMIDNFLPPKSQVRLICTSKCFVKGWFKERARGLQFSSKHACALQKIAKFFLKVILTDFR